MITIPRACWLTVVLSAAALAACDDPGGVKTPAGVQATGTTEFTGVVGTALPQPLAVTVSDKDGEPVANATVAWTATGGSVTPASVKTDKTGIARATWTLPTRAGSATATATVAGQPAVTFTATARADVAASLIFTPAALTLRSGYDSTVATTFRDRYGNEAAPVTLSWSSSDPTQVTTPSEGATPRFTAQAPGTATLTARAGTVTGTVAVTVTPLRLVAGSVGNWLYQSVFTWSCGLTTDAAVYCWAPGSPHVIDTSRRYTSFSGEGPSCGLEERGAVRCIRNSALDAEGSFRQVDTGYTYVCALDAAGSVFCWGTGPYGQLGDGVASGSDVLVKTPQRIAGGRSYTALSSGPSHSCAIAEGGTVYCWGLDQSGQLGRGGAADNCLLGACGRVPAAVVSSERFRVVAAGYGSSCALTLAGAAYCWGSNNAGQLGNGVTGGLSNVPIAVAGGQAFTSISVGTSHACAVRADGAAFCWGDNTNGAVGSGTVGGVSNTPQRVAGDLTFSSVAAGSRTTCASTPAGIAYCWGQNSSGQVGDGGRIDRATPTRVIWQ